MKKTNIILLVLIFTINLFAQDKTIEIKLSDKRILAGSYSAKNGYQFLKTSNKSKYGKKQKTKLMCFNGELEKIYEVDIDGVNRQGASFVSAFSFYATSEPSEYGNYFINDNQLIDKKGKIKSFKTDYNKQKHVNSIFSFFSDFGWTFIGPRKGRKYYKKQYTNDDINVYVIKNSDSKTILEKLKTPQINSNKKTVTWQMGESYPNKFYMIAKDEPNTDMNIDTYHIVNYDYNGNSISYVPLSLKLNKYHLRNSINDGASEFESESHMGNIAIGNVFFSNDNYYIYGALSEEAKDKKKINQKVNGFYFHKFDKQGKLIWKYNYLLKKGIKKYATEITINHKVLNNKTCAITFDFGLKKSSSEIGGFYIIDTEKGELIKNENPFGDFTYKMNNKIYKNTELKSINPTYISNRNKKIRINYNVFLSMVANTKIKNYINSNNKELFYDASFTKDGVILKELNQKERVLKLMLFKN